MTPVNVNTVQDAFKAATNVSTILGYEVRRNCLSVQYLVTCYRWWIVIYGNLLG